MLILPRVQRQLRAAARRVACLAAAALFSATALLAAQPGPAQVTVSEAVSQPVSAGHVFVGTVMPTRRSVVGSAVGGRVIEFPVNEGDRVKKGQPLASLLRRALEIQRDAAAAELEFRRHELAELEHGARPEEIEQAKAKMLSAKTVMDYAKNKLERTRSLFDRRAASQEQLQDDESAAERGTQNYIDAKSGWDLVVAGPRAEKIAQAKAHLGVAEEEVNRIEDQLDKHTIRAPFDGYVVKEHTEVGQWIAAGDPVAEVVEVDSVDVEVPVLENYVSHLQVGAPAKVEVNALPDHAKFEGQIALIVPQADLRSRSFPVKVRLKNEILPDGGPRLKPGMFARVELGVGRKDSVVMVPKDALVLGGNEASVFVVDVDPSDAKRGTVHAVAVVVGLATEALVEVRGAIEPGMRVVVEGNERLKEGELVTITNVKPAVPATASAAGTRS